jgi:hypothetical protein
MSQHREDDVSRARQRARFVGGHPARGSDRRSPQMLNVARLFLHPITAEVERRVDGHPGRGRRCSLREVNDARIWSAG